MQRLLCLSFVGLLLVGCSDNPTARFASKTQEQPTWGALEKLTSEDIMMGVDVAASQGNWAELIRSATTDEFKAAVDEFAAEEIPSKFATAERKTAKDEAVKALKNLIQLAESKASGDKLKAAYEAVQQHLQETSKP